MKEKIRLGYEIDVLSSFENKVKKTIRHIKQNNCKVQTKIIGNEARKINAPTRSIDIIITSPPYINAQKYFRSTQLELYWLDLVDNQKLRDLDEKMIGTERVKSNNYKIFRLIGLDSIDKTLKRYKEDKKIAYIISQYYSSMILVIKEMYRVLKKDGKLVLVMGDNNIKGKLVPSGKIFQDILVKEGFRLDKIYFDEIESYSLMTKRNNTANIIKREWVLVAKK